MGDAVDPSDSGENGPIPVRGEDFRTVLPSQALNPPATIPAAAPAPESGPAPARPAPSAGVSIFDDNAARKSYRSNDITIEIPKSASNFNEEASMKGLLGDSSSSSDKILDNPGPSREITGASGEVSIVASSSRSVPRPHAFKFMPDRPAATSARPGTVPSLFSMTDPGTVASSSPGTSAASRLDPGASGDVDLYAIWEKISQPMLGRSLDPGPGPGFSTRSSVEREAINYPEVEVLSGGTASSSGTTKPPRPVFQAPIEPEVDRKGKTKVFEESSSASDMSSSEYVGHDDGAVDRRTIRIGGEREADGRAAGEAVSAGIVRGAPGRASGAGGERRIIRLASGESRIVNVDAGETAAAAAPVAEVGAAAGPVAADQGDGGDQGDNGGDNAGHGGGDPGGHGGDGSTHGQQSWYQKCAACCSKNCTIL